MSTTDDREEPAEQPEQIPPPLPPGYRWELDAEGRIVAYIVGDDRWDFERTWSACLAADPDLSGLGHLMLLNLDPVVVEARLTEAFETGDQDLRALVAVLLADFRAHRAIISLSPVVLETMTHLPPDPAEKHRAIREIYRIPARRAEVEILVAQLDHSDWGRRHDAARALGQIADPRTSDPLLDRLRDEDPWVRVAAVRALGNICDPRTFDPLLALLEDANQWVVEAALNVLPSFGNRAALGPILRLLERPDLSPHMLERAVEALAELRDEQAIAPIIGLLRRDRIAGSGGAGAGEVVTEADPAWRETESLAHRIAHILGLYWRSPKSLPGLVAGLRDDDPRYSHELAFALGWLGDRRALAPLIEALGSRHESVARAALWAIGDLKDPNTLDLLLGYLTHPAATFRQVAAQGLGEIADPHALDPLVGALSDPAPEVRRAAAVAIGQIGDRRGTAALLSLLRTEPDGCVRLDGVRALGQIGDPSALSGLIDLVGAETGVCEDYEGWPESARDAMLEIRQLSNAGPETCGSG